MNCQKGKGCEYWDEVTGWQRDCCFLCKSQTECLMNPNRMLTVLDDVEPCHDHKQFRKCRDTEGK